MIMKLATEMLKNHFSRFGEIVDCVVPKDPKTKFAKGFGFVTFTRGTAVDEVMNNRPHKVEKLELETEINKIIGCWSRS